MVEQNTLIIVYSDRKMTQELGVKKVLKIIATDCDQPVRNLRKIAYDLLIGNYEVVENGNYYVEIYQQRNSDSSLQVGINNSKQLENQQGGGLNPILQKDNVSLRIGWLSTRQITELQIQSTNLKSLSKQILENDDKDG